jgi:hypothetical protein
MAGPAIRAMSRCGHLVAPYCTPGCSGRRAAVGLAGRGHRASITRNGNFRYRKWPGRKPRSHGGVSGSLTVPVSLGGIVVGQWHALVL